MTEHIASLSAAGLPLPSGLRALAQEQPSRRLRTVLNRLSDSLEAGEPLETAIGAKNSSVPKHVSGLVAAGLRTGRLGEVLGRFAAFASFGTDLRKHVWLNLLYPFVTWIVATVVIVFLLVALAGNFGSIFRDFGMPMPVLTQFLIRTSDLATAQWTKLAYLALGGVVFAIAMRLFLPVAQWRSLIARIPVLGRVWRFTSLAEFCHLLALLLESEVPLADALIMTGEGVQDFDINRNCRQMTTDVESGLRLSEAMEGRRLFPDGFARILAWAEDHQSVPEALHMAGEMLESKAKAQAVVTIILCNVLTIMAIILGIVLIIGAIMFPLIQLITRLF